MSDPRCPVCGEAYESPAIGPQPAACWWNAFERFRIERPSDNRCTYVEGWAVRRRQDEALEPFEHGWVELSDGSRLDPTPHHHAIEYFAALRFDDREMDELLRHRLTVPFYREVIVDRHGDEGNPHFSAQHADRYADAKQQAERYCLERNGH